IRRRHTRSSLDWSSDVCSSDLTTPSLKPIPMNVGEFSEATTVKPIPMNVGELSEATTFKPIPMNVGEFSEATTFKPIPIRGKEYFPRNSPKSPGSFEWDDLPPPNLTVKEVINIITTNKLTDLQASEL